MKEKVKHDSRSLDDLNETLRAIYLYSAQKFKEEYPQLSQPMITQTYRTPETQNELYRQGRTKGKKGITVTNAKGGESPHNFHPALAFDIAFLNTKEKLDWEEDLFVYFSKILLEKFGDKVTWGGNFKKPDRPHFELKNWKQLK